MQPNILVTGAAGYIGGSIIADFLASENLQLEKQHIRAAVRSADQADALSKLGVNAFQLELTDENAILDVISRQNINIVIHTASAIDPALALPLITALSKRKQSTGEDVSYIHTSGLSAFYPRTGWPPQQFKDTDPIFEVEKELADSFPIRKTDVTVLEHAKAHDVRAFILVPCMVYGKGSGPWNQLSVVLPAYVKASITDKRVHKFAEDPKISAVHISDLTTLYGLIVERIVQNDAPSSGTQGYYFALAHDVHMWELLDRLAGALKERDLVTDSRTQVWSSIEAAARSLGVPEQFVEILWNAGENLVSDNETRLGWKPTWDKDRFMRNIDDEIEAVLELDKPKSSLIDSLFQAAKG